MVRAKMKVMKMTEHAYGGHEVRLEAQYDETIPEDQRFCEATPSGHLEMHVNNPEAVKQLPAGKSFYLDLTPVPE